MAANEAATTGQTLLGIGEDEFSLLKKQGCQMVCFQAINPNLSKSWRALDWKMLVYFRVIF
jgi:uncharacterized membrane protein